MARSRARRALGAWRWRARRRAVLWAAARRLARVDVRRRKAEALGGWSALPLRRAQAAEAARRVAGLLLAAVLRGWRLARPARARPRAARGGGALRQWAALALDPAARRVRQARRNGLRLRILCYGAAGRALLVRPPPPPHPPSRTNWTRLVPPPVLTGHAPDPAPAPSAAADTRGAGRQGLWRRQAAVERLARLRARARALAAFRAAVAARAVPAAPPLGAISHRTRPRRAQTRCCTAPGRC